MQTQSVQGLPDKVNTFWMAPVGVGIYSAVLSITKSDGVDGQPKFSWGVEKIYSHNDGKIIDPAEDKEIASRIKQTIKKDKLFDAEYIFYKILSSVVASNKIKKDGSGVI